LVCLNKPTHSPVTIVIPTLNEESGIRQVLQGIPYNELGNVQVIVVDGGSVDGTPEIARARASLPSVAVPLRFLSLMLC
jgi:glycosyltransferase involved in cell wall biosynthesis